MSLVSWFADGAPGELTIQPMVRGETARKEIMIPQTDIDDFLSDRRANNIHNSDNTSRSYRRIIEDWNAFIGSYDFKGGRDTSELKKASRDFLAFCTQSKSGRQIKSELYVLNSFYNYHGYKNNPFPAILQAYRVPKREAVTKRMARDERVMTEKEVFEIKNRAGGLCAGKTGVELYLAHRNLLVVELLSEYGMRVSALVGIDINDIDFERRLCLIRASKNQEPYIVPIIRKTQNIKDYMEIMYKHGPAIKSKSPGTPLFISKTGRRLSDTSARRSVNSIFESLGIYEGQRSTHQLRHYRATKYYKEGMRIDLIAKIMGISVPVLKSTYLHLSHMDTVSEYERWSGGKPENFECPNCGYRKGEKIESDVYDHHPVFEVVK